MVTVERDEEHKIYICMLLRHLQIDLSAINIMYKVPDREVAFEGGAQDWRAKYASTYLIVVPKKE
jgi:hypothetical protein